MQYFISMYYHQYYYYVTSSSISECVHSVTVECQNQCTDLFYKMTNSSVSVGIQTLIIKPQY